MLRHVVQLFALTILVAGVASGADSPANGPLTVVVMDPLSSPLACDCVQGYAQRKYEKLGEYLSKKLNRPVNVHWYESLVTATREITDGRADLVIGKHSVVEFDAKKLKRSFVPVASLTGTDGQTTQTGLIVVRKADAANEVADLDGYRIFFGPEECDEKSAAPRQLLMKQGVSLPAKVETYPACSNAATALVELDPNVKAAAVISSYAQPLLEGCGTIKKGDLRVVGTSAPVPFITAFVNAGLPEPERQAIQHALFEVIADAELTIALETADGFVEFKAPADTATPDTAPAADAPNAAETSASAAKKKTP